MTALAGRARVRLPDVAAFALVALAAALSAAFYGDLPAEMVVGWHVGLDGAVATTRGPRLLGAALLPAIAAALFALLRALPRVGDLEREIESARSLYDGLVLLVLATLVGVHAFVVFANLG